MRFEPDGPPLPGPPPASGGRGNRVGGPAPHGRRGRIRWWLCRAGGSSRSEASAEGSAAGGVARLRRRLPLRRRGPRFLQPLPDPAVARMRRRPAFQQGPGTPGEPRAYQRLAGEVVAVGVGGFDGRRLVEALERLLLPFQADERPPPEHARLDRAGVVLEPAAADLHRARKLTGLEQRTRQLHEDARARVGLQDAFVLLDDGGGHARGLRERWYHARGTSPRVRLAHLAGPCATRAAKRGCRRSPGWGRRRPDPRRSREAGRHPCRRPLGSAARRRAPRRRRRRRRRAGHSRCR